MKILLLQPRYETYLVTPPLGLGYIASSLMEAGNEVVIEDCILTGRSPSEAAPIFPAALTAPQLAGTVEDTHLLVSAGVVQRPPCRAHW